MPEETKPQDWRERMRAIGREAFILEEMTRLGFWPLPEDPEGDQKRAAALATLKVNNAELASLQTTLSEVNTTIRSGQDAEAALKAIRQKRIEKSHQRRAERRLERVKIKQAKQLADKKRRKETPPYLGQGVSAGLHFNRGDPIKVASLGLPALETAGEIARSIGIDEASLQWLTYHRGAATIDHYHRFTIPKRKGGLRIISSPKRRLRVAQSWLLHAILSRLPVHDAAMAFRPRRSIVDNAQKHQNRAIVIRMDLKDFFPSIHFRRVKGLFQSFGYNEGVATILALISTEAPRLVVTLDGATRYVSTGRRQLPQGACTSPAITNLLCRNLDKRLAGLCKKFDFTYSRYADDLIFSTVHINAPLGAFLKLVKVILEKEGFILNEEKTLVMRQQHRQAVTGIVVNNEIPNISRRDLRRYRAFLHQCETEGLKTVSDKLGKNALNYARGYLAFIQMVSPEKAFFFKAAHSWLTTDNI